MGGGPESTTHPSVKGKLLFAWPLDKPTAVIERISQRYPNLEIEFVNAQKEKISDDQYRSATFLSTFGTIPKDLSLFSNIQFIHLTSAGINHLAAHPIYTDSKIPLTTSSGIHGPTIAEWVILTILSHAHRFPMLLDWQKQEKWQPFPVSAPVLAGVRDYASSTIAILGYGSIGRQIARVSKGLGMNVLAYTASPRTTDESKKDTGYIVPHTGDPDGTIPDQWLSGLDKKSLHDFLGQDFDVLVVAVPLTAKTKYFLAEEEFSLLGRPSGRKPLFVNIARGQLAVTSALLSATKLFVSSGGKEGLRGAALDVTDPEPLPDHDPLWSAENVFVSPHVSAHCVDYGDRSAQVLEGNLERWREGRELWNLVDRGRGY